MTIAAPTLLAILAHTPIWVWAIFALVAFLGYQRTRDRTVQLWRMFILPVLMVVTAVSSVIGGGIAVLPAIVVGFVIGGTAGWLLEREGATRRLPDGKIWLRGEWLPMVQVLAIFLFRYSTTVVGIVYPALGGDLTYHLATTLISSLLSAMMLGRTLARLRVYFNTPAAA